MALLVINLSRVDQQVAVISDSGQKTSVRIMDRSRVHLPDGYSVDPRWLSMNSNVIRVIDEKPPVQPAQAPVVADVVAQPVTTEVVVTAAHAEDTGGTE